MISHKKFIENIIESTKITETPDGYEIEHIFNNLTVRFNNWNNISGENDAIMCTSNHAFIFIPENGRLSIYSYQNYDLKKKLFEVHGGYISFNYDDKIILPLTEEQYFQQNTRYDFYDLELEDMIMIHEFYTVISEYMLKKLSRLMRRDILGSVTQLVRVLH